jgi:hypothetical protein
MDAVPYCFGLFASQSPITNILTLSSDALVLILARDHIDPRVRVVPIAEEMVPDWSLLNIPIEKHHLTSLIMLTLSFEFPSPGLDPHHVLPDLNSISSSSSRHPPKQFLHPLHLILPKQPSSFVGVQQHSLDVELANS